MADAAATILFVGDMHLGRRPRRLPRGIADASELGPAGAWSATVDFAVRERVDAVVLAGDVVESENARFEAYGRLQRGVKRLVDHGVRVFAVAGNHDVEVLPRLAAQIDGFTLLGRGGVFETVTVARAGTPLVHLAGWSFPRARVTSSPFAAGFPDLPRDGLPVLGVLHGDLDRPGSVYAPVARAELERAGADAWFLGHVHQPSLEAAARPPIGYLGSLVGLDPGEPGRRGPWLVRAAPRSLHLEHVPLAPLRFEEVAVPAAAFSDGEDPQRPMNEALAALADRLRPELGAVRAVAVRVNVSGAAASPSALRARLAALPLPPRDEPSPLQFGDTLFFVHEVAVDLRPRIDLATLAGDAGAADPPGLLARVLLDLERGGPRAEELLRDARARLAPVAGQAAFAPLALDEGDALGGASGDGLDAASIARLLRSAGEEALLELIGQVPAAAAAAEPSRTDPR